MAIQTQPTDADPRDFIARVKNKTRRQDALVLLDVYAQCIDEPPVMWGDSLIGYGAYHYKYASGHEGTFFKGGFSPREAKMVVYLMLGVEQYADRLNAMGPYKTGRSCLYLGTFAKLDLSILQEVIKDDFQKMSEKYG